MAPRPGPGAIKLIQVHFCSQSHFYKRNSGKVRLRSEVSLSKFYGPRPCSEKVSFVAPGPLMNASKTQSGSA